MSPSAPRPLTPDASTYRTVHGHFATGVVIVTAICDTGEPVGMACNSFTSVSLDPPLVLFCAAKSSSTWPRIETSGKWAANILDEDGEEVCRLFAEKGADRFARIAYTLGRSGSPILEDALAFVDCETIDKHDAGDHVIVVGRIIELGYQHEGKPLLFYRGGYGRYEI
jgi:3-hydroxy-9,10-secoandrosta-1,3,5(10)-triene-9,17-dione monooxygenase reductase component